VELFDAAVDVLSIGRGPVVELLAPLNGQAEVLAVAEPAFKLRFHVLSIEGVAVIVLVHKGKVLDVGQRILLGGVAAETWVGVQGALTEALEVVSETRVEIIFAVVVVKGGSAQQRRPHLCPKVGVHSNDPNALSCHAVIRVPNPPCLAEFTVDCSIIKSITSERLPSEVDAHCL
jgi:hypothetical protein